MNYLDVYYSRINHLGDTKTEIIRNGGIRAFEKWLMQSPFTVNHLSVERGLYFSGIIEEKKDQEESKIMFLHVANDIPLQVGDIMNWRVDDGSIEKWLLINEKKKTNGTYRTFWIIRCNYLVKWINNDGILRSSWAYVLSSKDDQIKGNFRTWHNLITPQPNKYAEIIMPHIDIDRGTNFIIEDEGWQFIEYDRTSVPGIIYLSLTESKVNLINDDLDEDIADMDKLKFPTFPAMFIVGDIIIPEFEGNSFNEVAYELSSSNKRVVDDDMVAIAPGTTVITLTLTNHPTIFKKYEITVRAADEDFSAYIDGVDELRLDRQTTYTLKGTEEFTLPVKFSVNNEELATIVPSYENNLCILHANRKNKLGEIILTATYNDESYFKTIKIIPLW